MAVEIKIGQTIVGDAAAVVPVGLQDSKEVALLVAAELQQVGDRLADNRRRMG